MPIESILVVEPDTLDRQLLVAELRRNGYDVMDASNATAAISGLRDRVADMVVLEWALPDLPGVEVLKGLHADRRFDRTRVLMTSPRSHDAVEALNAGADDFVPKPYSVEELSARIAICLKKPPISQSLRELLTAGPVAIDDASHRVLIYDGSLDLAPREYRLLHFFMSNPDRMFSRRQLLARVWDQNVNPGERTVDVHVRRLRSRLAPYGCEDYIQTIRGEGYRFSVPNEAQSAVHATKAS